MRSTDGTDRLSRRLKKSSYSKQEVADILKKYTEVTNSNSKEFKKWQEDNLLNSEQATFTAVDEFLFGQDF